MVAKFNEMETTFIVDSMPLEICKNAKRTALKFVRKMNFRFPAKVIALLNRVIIMVTNYMLFVLFPEFSKVLIFLQQTFMIFIFARYQASNEQLYVDWRQGYLSTQVQTDLFNYANIKLDTP